MENVFLPNCVHNSDDQDINFQRHCHYIPYKENFLVEILVAKITTQLMYEIQSKITYLIMRDEICKNIIIFFSAKLVFQFHIIRVSYKNISLRYLYYIILHNIYQIIGELSKSSFFFDGFHVCNLKFSVEST